MCTLHICMNVCFACGVRMFFEFVFFVSGLAHMGQADPSKACMAYTGGGAVTMSVYQFYLIKYQILNSIQ